MQQARVAEIDLRCLDLPLAEIGEPGLQLANQVGLRQQVEVASHGALVDAQRSGRLRRVPHLAVIVGQHGPEPVERRGRNVYAELRQIPLDCGADELASPDGAAGIIGRGEGAREAAAQPQGRRARETGLVKRKAADLDDFDPPGERLARLAQQGRRGTAEQQEASRQAGSIDQHPQTLNRSGACWISSMTTKSAQIAQEPRAARPAAPRLAGPPGRTTAVNRAARRLERAWSCQPGAGRPRQRRGCGQAPRESQRTALTRSIILHRIP